VHPELDGLLTYAVNGKGGDDTYGLRRIEKFWPGAIADALGKQLPVDPPVDPPTPPVPPTEPPAPVDTPVDPPVDPPTTPAPPADPPAPVDPPADPPAEVDDPSNELTSLIPLFAVSPSSVFCNSLVRILVDRNSCIKAQPRAHSKHAVHKAKAHKKVRKHRKHRKRRR